jgi:hypothetical protein
MNTGRPLVRSGQRDALVFIPGTKNVHSRIGPQRALLERHNYNHGGRGDWRNIKTEASRIGPQPKQLLFAETAVQTENIVPVWLPLISVVVPRKFSFSMIQVALALDLYVH